MRWSHVRTIIVREYVARVKTRAFVVSTVLVPLFLAAIMVLPSLLATRQKGTLALGLEDRTGRLRESFMERLAGRDDGKLARLITVVDIPAGTTGEALTAMIDQGRIDGYIVLDDEAVKTGKVTYRARVTTNIMLQGDLQDLLSEVFAADRLRTRGFDAAVVRELSTPVDLKAVGLSGDEEAAGEMRFLIAYGMFFVLYFVQIIYGQNVMRGVLEEKTSRIVEVIVSSVRPTELMMGKLVGIGSVALTQLAIWIASAAVLTGGPMAGMASGDVHIPRLEPALVAHFIFYFVAGFFLYATNYAVIGAMNNSEQEAQQMSTIALFPIMAPVLFVMTIINDPNSALAVGTSVFPLFTPLLMTARLAVGAAKPLEIVVADVLLLGTILLQVILAARIYRVGILMYGKRPTIPEIIRWARYR